jgi:signal transduction histidine kinase
MGDMKESLAMTGIYKGYNIKLLFDDETKYLNVNASRVYQNGIHTNSIIILEDVTEKKLLDEKLQNIDRLASIGRFAAGIAHEIRNPLTGLSLFLDDLHDNLGSQNKTYLPLISTALSEIERLDKLIKEILEYAMPSKGIIIETNIIELIESILLLIEKQLKRHDINVIKKFASNNNLINLDPERIKQALLNIFLNSIHFMPDGGDLVISTVVNMKNSTPNYLEIIIEDSGTGFKENEILKIFDPFFTNREGGTGLGLAITNSIISEHNGSIIASNRIKGGAKFTIRLPFNNQ